MREELSHREEGGVLGSDVLGVKSAVNRPSIVLLLEMVGSRVVIGYDWITL
jgi:hypothetical protein